MSESRRGAYTGDARKLVVAIDIGTTYTAASFSLLEPGDVPQIHQIQSWPEQVTSDAKVPSVVLYDKLGTARAFGAATDDDGVKDQAADEKWTKAEWWKLRLRPGHLPIIRDLKLPALPPATTLDRVFADFLGYVKQQLETYVKAKYGDGDKIWNACLPSLELVLTTPNGWELDQQQRMRAAAQKSELVVGDDSAQRVRFVTEAEAALLYSIDSGCIGEWLKLGNELIVCDCGGGTIDITNYKITGLGPLRLEETTTSACYLAGGVFVTQACQKYLKSHLKGTEWANDYSVEQAVSKFENNAKRKFSGTDTTSWIELGGSKSILGKDIKRGKLRLPAEKVASFFADSLEKVKQGLSDAYRKSGNQAKVILVGGFASSPYVFGELQEWGRTLGMSLSRPDGPASKPVPDGALLWYLDAAELTTASVMPRVTARINKVYYGTSSVFPWIPFVPEMIDRPRVLGPSGDLMTPGGWSTIVAKDEKIENGREYTESYTAMKVNLGDESYPFTCPIYIYRGEEPPLFLTRPESPMDRELLHPGFEELCTIHADLSESMKAAPVQIGVFNQGYKEVEFTVCLTFGDTELRARVRWEDKGETKYGKATVVSRAHAE